MTEPHTGTTRCTFKVTNLCFFKRRRRWCMLYNVTQKSVISPSLHSPVRSAKQTRVNGSSCCAARSKRVRRSIVLAAIRLYDKCALPQPQWGIRWTGLIGLRMCDLYFSSFGHCVHGCHRLSIHRPRFPIASPIPVYVSIFVYTNIPLI